MHVPFKEIIFLLVFTFVAIVFKALNILEYLIYGVMAYLAWCVVMMLFIAIKLLIGQYKESLLKKQRAVNQGLLFAQLAKDMRELRNIKKTLPKSDQELISQLETDVSELQSKKKPM